MKPQGITDIVQANRMTDLCIDQAQDVTPGAEGARLRFRACFPGQLGHQMNRYEIAKLPQDAQLRRRWGGVLVVFHTCRVAVSTAPFQHFFQKAVGRL
jgi:hypothetical protein